MIVWLNGTFGAGKTTTAAQLADELCDARIVDTELIGTPLLDSVLAHSHPVGDFQDWPPWRRLVVETVRSLWEFTSGTLVIPQTVLVHAYWREIADGLAGAGIGLHHFVLHSDSETLRQRIEQDHVETGARQ